MNLSKDQIDKTNIYYDEFTSSLEFEIEKFKSYVFLREQGWTKSEIINDMVEKGLIVKFIGNVRIIEYEK